MSWGDVATCYGGDAKGYTDYPVLDGAVSSGEIASNVEQKNPFSWN